MNNDSPPSPSPVSFTSPQATIPDENAQKTTIYADKRVITKLNTWRNRSGTLTRTINILLTKLCDSLERAGVGEYDPDTYEQLVAGCYIKFNPISAEFGTTNGSTQQQPIPPSSQTNLPDERPGVGRVSKESAQQPPLVTNPKRAPRRLGGTHTGTGRLLKGE